MPHHPWLDFISNMILNLRGEMPSEAGKVTSVEGKLFYGAAVLRRVLIACMRRPMQSNDGPLDPIE